MAIEEHNDSLYGGIDSINNGKFKGGHDNLQQFNVNHGRGGPLQTWALERRFREMLQRSVS